MAVTDFFLSKVGVGSAGDSRRRARKHRIEFSRTDRIGLRTPTRVGGTAGTDPRAVRCSRGEVTAAGGQATKRLRGWPSWSSFFAGGVYGGPMERGVCRRTQSGSP